MKGSAFEGGFDEFVGFAEEEFAAAVADFFFADDADAWGEPEGAAEFDAAVHAGHEHADGGVCSGGDGDVFAGDDLEVADAGFGAGAEFAEGFSGFHAGVDEGDGGFEPEWCGDIGADEGGSAHEDFIVGDGDEFAFGGGVGSGDFEAIDFREAFGGDDFSDVAAEAFVGDVHFGGAVCGNAFREFNSNGVAPEVVFFEGEDGDVRVLRCVWGRGFRCGFFA